MEATRLGKKLFRSYYRRLSPSRVEVGALREREFAFVFFEGAGMLRHLSFESSRDLVEYLARRVPRHAYHSSAYYEQPSARNMDEKGWKGADLVFDIDVDHIDTPCKELHDRWICRSCGAVGWGVVDKCPKCGGESIEREVWVCETCINVARDETLKLLDFLEHDFGLSPDELYITFSGHRGFHVHVESEAVVELSQDARREIVDYVKGVGLDYRFILAKARGRSYRLRYGSSAPGWFSRIARWAYVEVEEVGGELTLSLSKWKRLIDLARKREGAVVDERVTIDTRRLIRLPNTLHGKSGLRVAPMKLQELESAEVLEKAKVFTHGYARVKVRNPPRRVLDLELESGILELPLYLAVYLVLNGADVESFEFE